MSRISAGAAVGTVAWVAPQILTAKPAAGQSLSQSPAATGVSTQPLSTPLSTGSTNVGATTAANVGGTGTPPGGAGTPVTLSSLAQTGLNLQRDAEIGAIMIASGWALQRWASRSPHPATGTASESGNGGGGGDFA